MPRSSDGSARAEPPLIPTGWGSWLWYETAYYIAMATYTLGFSFRWEGAKHMPRRGPALLVANHQSFLDPVAIGLAARRHICYLARKTLFNHRLFGAYLRSVNTVPVDQEGVAKDGLRTVLKLLEAGQPVLVFPEGERTHKGPMNPLRPGVHLLIRRSMVPIVPVGIAGAYEVFPRSRALPRFAPFFLPTTVGGLAVSIGKPIDPARYEGMPRQEVLADLSSQIQACQAHAEKLRRKPGK